MPEAPEAPEILVGYCIKCAQTYVRFVGESSKGSLLKQRQESEEFSKFEEEHVCEECK